MAKYLTLSQFFLFEDSLPMINNIPASIVSRTIARAESLIDSYVGFDVRFGGFEPHTAWTQDTWDDETLRIRVPNFPVPVRLVDRYRIQTSNLADGSGFFANINSADCVINAFSGYVEIVPLQAITYSAAPFTFGLGLRPPLIQMDYEAGFYLPSLGEILMNDSGDLKTYRALRGFWATTYNIAKHIQPNALPPVPPVVYINGAVQASNTYTFDPIEGVVTFNAALSMNGNVAPTVTCDYTYTIPDPVRDATIAQVREMLIQRDLNQRGLGGIEVARSRDLNIKRHIRTSSGTSAKDEPTIAIEAMQLLEPYTYIPGA